MPDRGLHGAFLILPPKESDVIPTCVRKGLPKGARQRTCVQGPELSQGEFFFSSSPTLLGLALNTVFYPFILTAPLGTIWSLQIRRGCSSIGLSPFLFLRWGKVLPRLSDLLPPKGILALDRGLSAADARGIPSPTTPLLFVCCFPQTPFLSHFFKIRISLILWGHKPL